MAFNIANLNPITAQIDMVSKGVGNFMNAAKADPRVAILMAFLQGEEAKKAAQKAQIKKSAFQEKDSGLEYQQEALNQLRDIAKTGQTAASNLQRQNFLNQENTRLAGNRDAILRGEQMRSGGNTTGNRLTAQLMDAQGSAGRGNQNALESANLVQQNQMQALGGLGGFTGQLQNRASAIDAIRQFNANNIMQGGLAAAGSYGQVAQNNQYNAGLQQQQNQALLGLLGDAGRGTGAAIGSDRRIKTDIKDAKGDVQEFLDRLNEKRYKYKGQDETKTGIIAQDLEKSDVGKDLVFDTPEGKMVDLNETTPVLLAAVANLNKRLKGLEYA